MNREESLKDFKENVAKNLIEKRKNEFEKILVENEDILRVKLINKIKDLGIKVKEVQEKDKDYKIVVIQIELLRINVLKENYKIWVHGYNNKWYLDEDSIYEELDLKFLFNPFIELKKELIKAKKVYIGKINNYDVEELIFETVAQCYKNMSQKARAWLWNLDENQWINEGSFSDIYIVKWSEYRSDSETIFAMDKREKIREQLLELKNVPKEKLPFVYSVWRKSSFQDIELDEEAMLFINFKESNLKNISFTSGLLIMSQFKDTKIKNCNFKSSKLIGASFENSALEKCNFDEADVKGVNFKNVKLKDITFKNSDLRGAAFIEATLENVVFEGADVTEAIFSEQQVPFLHLTPEQLQTIYISGGE